MVSALFNRLFRTSLSPAQLIANFVLSWLSALLLVSAFPRIDLRLLSAVALTPMLIALARTENAAFRFFMGWSAGIVYWFTLCTWIQFVLEVHGGMGKFGGWATFLLFCLAKALHLAVFAWLAGPLMWRVHAVPAIAALWVGLERTHGTLGFAWLALGNAGIDMSVPLRLAPFVGVYGVSFVLCALAIGLAIVALRYPRRHLIPFIGLPALLLLPSIPQRMPAPQHAAVVQPNIDTEAMWTEGSLQGLTGQLALLSKALPAQLVIWPEMPAPLYFDENPPFHQLAESIARQHKYFLFGSVLFNANRSPLNSAILLGPEGQNLGHYDKVYLVPFGEFVPPFFSWVNRISGEISDFVPGHDIKVFPAGHNSIGAFICYESAFPHLVRQFSASGANMLVNLSNDGYFGHSAAYQQHLLLVRMRAVENRRFILRVTNDGVTASIDPAGRVLGSIKPYTQAAALLPFGTVEEKTFYAQHGDWFAWSCLVLGLASAAHAQISSRIMRRAA